MYENRTYFDAQERDIVIMALMYLKNDHTAKDRRLLSIPSSKLIEEKVQLLIEDFVGPTWDEEGTAEEIKKQCDRLSRKWEC